MPSKNFTKAQRAALKSAVHESEKLIWEMERAKSPTLVRLYAEALADLFDTLAKEFSPEFLKLAERSTEQSTETEK
jgi:Zn-dependent M32 family carboxypeptidase